MEERIPGHVVLRLALPSINPGDLRARLAFDKKKKDSEQGKEKEREKEGKGKREKDREREKERERISRGSYRPHIRTSCKWHFPRDHVLRYRVAHN